MKNLKQDLQETYSKQGGPYFIHLLFEEEPVMPQNSVVLETLRSKFNDVKEIGESDVYMFALEDYQVEYEDGVKAPTLVMLAAAQYQDKPEIDELARSQFWDVEDGETKLNQCKYQVICNDMMAEGMPYLERTNALMDYLDAILSLFPTCKLVYFNSSQKLLHYEDACNNPYTGPRRILWGGCNARFFNIKDTQDCIVDTIGLGAFGLPDMQYHFKNTVNVNDIINHAYNMAIYQFENNIPVQDNDTINGLGDSNWICRYEDSLIQPKRVVLDVYMNEFAAGSRD